MAPVGTIRMSLDGITRLLKALNNPHEHLNRVIHVTGTNGKGSVCALLEAMALEAGLSCGRFTSPHFLHPSESIRLNGQCISQSEYQQLANEVSLADQQSMTSESIKFESIKSASVQSESSVNRTDPSSDSKMPSYTPDSSPDPTVPISKKACTVFEHLTAIAFVAFARANLDLVILEVGMGGRDDATNVQGIHKIATIFTSMSMDHTDYLGPLIQDICANKAGIMRQGAPVFLEYLRH